MTYRLIHDLQQKAFPVTHACRVLEVSRAGYYQYRQRGPCEADVVDTVRLKAAFAASGRSYGSRRRLSPYEPRAPLLAAIAFGA